MLIANRKGLYGAIYFKKKIVLKRSFNYLKLIGVCILQTAQIRIFLKYFVFIT